MPFENTHLFSVLRNSSKCWCKFAGRFSRFVVTLAVVDLFNFRRRWQPTKRRALWHTLYVCVRDVHVYLYIHIERLDYRRYPEESWPVRIEAAQQREKRIDPFSYSHYIPSSFFFCSGCCCCPVPSTIHEMRCYKHIDTRRLLSFFLFIYKQKKEEEEETAGEMTCRPFLLFLG